MLQVDLLAQFTLPHLVHCQSSAENNPLDFSAAEAPISIPCFLVLSSFFSRPHLLQLDLLAKLTFPHPASVQVQSPSEGLKSPPGILQINLSSIQIKNQDSILSALTEPVLTQDKQSDSVPSVV